MGQANGSPVLIVEFGIVFFFLVQNFAADTAKATELNGMGAWLSYTSNNISKMLLENVS